MSTSAAALAAEQAEVLARAQVRLDELIGLDGPKEQIAVWCTEIQIDQLLAAQGEETSSTNENHREGAVLCEHVVDQWFCWLSSSVRAAPGKDRGQDGAPAV